MKKKLVTMANKSNVVEQEEQTTDVIMEIIF